MSMSHCAKQICFVKRLKKKKKRNSLCNLFFLCKTTGCDRDRKHKKQYLYRLINCNDNLLFCVWAEFLKKMTCIVLPQLRFLPSVASMYVYISVCGNKKSRWGQKTRHKWSLLSSLQSTLAHNTLFSEAKARFSESETAGSFWAV